MRSRRDKSSVYIEGSIFSSDDFPMTCIRLGSHLTSLIGCVLLITVLVFTSSTIRISRKTHFLYLMVSIAQIMGRVPWKLLDYELIQPTLAFLAHFLLIAIASVHQKYGKQDDPFRWKFLVLPTIVLALISSYRRSTISVQTTSQSWGHYLDAVAMLPQLSWLAVSRIHSNVNTKVLHAYVNIQAAAKTLSIIHWVYLYRDHKKYDHLAVMCDLFYLSCHVLFVGFMILRRQGVWRNTADTLLIKS